MITEDLRLKIHLKYKSLNLKYPVKEGASL